MTRPAGPYTKAFTPNPADVQVLAQDAADTYESLRGIALTASGDEVITLRWCVEKTLEWWSIPTTGATYDAVSRSASSIIR